MVPSQAPLPPATPSMSHDQVILPSRVWMSLTGEQQRHLLHTIVLVCQEMVATWSHIQQGKVTHE